jgi:hypothetical protein
MTELRPNQWLGMVVKLTAPMDAAKAATAALEMEPAVSLIPSYKLTQESAIYTALKSKRMPNYGAICALTDEWYEANRPKPAALLAGPPGWWTEEYKQAKQREYVDACRRDWSQPEAVRSEVARLMREHEAGNRMALWFGHLLATAVSNHGKENLGLIPPEWMPRQ